MFILFWRQTRQGWLISGSLSVLSPVKCRLRQNISLKGTGRQLEWMHKPILLHHNCHVTECESRDRFWCPYPSTPPGKGESCVVGACAWVSVGTFQACSGPTVRLHLTLAPKPSPTTSSTNPTHPSSDWETRCRTSVDLTLSCPTADTTTREGSSRSRRPPGCQSPSTRCRRWPRSRQGAASTARPAPPTRSNSLRGAQAVVVCRGRCQSSWRRPTWSWVPASISPLPRMNFSQGRKSLSSQCDKFQICLKTFGPWSNYSEIL